MGKKVGNLGFGIWETRRLSWNPLEEAQKKENIG